MISHTVAYIIVVRVPPNFKHKLNEIIAGRTGEVKLVDIQLHPYVPRRTRLYLRLNVDV